MSSRERREKQERQEHREKREELFKLIAEQVEKLGYECVHVGLNNTAGLSIQILIDSLGGINLSDCERVSKTINLMLDKIDSDNKNNNNDKNSKEKDNKNKDNKNKEDDGYLAGIKGRYYLEVSSPGIERPLFTLEHYRRFIGREARLRLNEPFEGRKTLSGKIMAVLDEVTSPSLTQQFALTPLKGEAKKSPPMGEMSPKATERAIKIYLKDEEREMTVPFKIIKAGNLKFEEGLY